MESSTADTPRDNIDCICRAFAIVDERFANAHKLFAKGSYALAAAAAKKFLDSKQATYLSAATHYLYAEALIKAGKLYDAVDAYTEILVNMPDRISFGASAGLKAAKTYEKLGRLFYAMKMYVYCVKNYGLTLDKDEVERMVRRIEEIQKIYRDPLNTLAGDMGDVVKRLDEIDSGKETQKKQEQIVALLEDLIKTAEEQAKQGQGQGQGKGQGKGKRQGEGRGQGQGRGRPQGTGTPSSPAQISAVVPGAVERPHKLSRIRESRQSGVWATLPPVEKMRLEAIRKKLMSERNRDQISDYRTSLTRER